MAQTSLQVAVAQGLRRARKPDLETYVRGLIAAGWGYRSVADNLRELTGVPVSHPTIMRWEEQWKKADAEKQGSAA